MRKPSDGARTLETAGVNACRATLMLTLKRAYDAVSPADGTRILVERLWPRGLTKTELQAHAWLKEVAPSTELRKWFNHDPRKWSDFRRRYFRELDERPESWREIVSSARRGTVTLIYSSRDAEHNNAVALKQYLQRRITGGKTVGPASTVVRPPRTRG